MARRKKHSSRYLSYLRSPTWFERRKQHFARHGADCKVCGTLENMHLHHKTYERLGMEPDAHLVALCESCHKKVHAYARKHRELSLWQATDHFIKGRRARA